MEVEASAVGAGAVLQEGADGISHRVKLLC